MSKKWASYTFSLFLKHEMSYTSNGRREKTSLKPLATMDRRWNQRSSQMWWRNEQELPSPEPRTVRTNELNGSAGGRGKGIRGPRSFVSRLVAPTGTKGPCPPAGPPSHWTRNKSHLLSRAQRQPGQMAWNKGLFCSSVSFTHVHFLAYDCHVTGSYF